MDVLRNVFRSVSVGERDWQADDAGLRETHPVLFELLCATPKEGGRRRTVATLTLVAEDGVWKGGIRDRDHAVSLWVSAETFGGVLDVLETQLTGVSVPWRKSPEAQSRNRK